MYDMVFKSIGMPMKCHKGKRRYCLQFKYSLKSDHSKVKSKTIRFGKKGRDYYIDHKNI